MAAMGENIWETERKSLVDACNEKLKIQNDDESLLKSKGICNKLMEVSCDDVEKEINSANSKDTIKSWFQFYTQATLDLTFYDENQLVEDDFPLKDGKERLQQILDMLDKPQKLVCIVPDMITCEILGEELAECISWRRGALLYMYCCTVEQGNRIEEDKEHFLKCCKAGVGYLEEMLSVRMPITGADVHAKSQEGQVLALLKQGAFSDTHVLAMMYAGELCYWYSLYGQSNNFDAKETGRRMLNRFVRLVKGPLKGYGWDCRRAEELIGKMLGCSEAYV